MLKLRQCTEKDINDKFFVPESDDWPRETIIANYLKYMICLDNPNLIELDGQLVNGDGTFLKVAWH